MEQEWLGKGGSGGGRGWSRSRKGGVKVEVVEEGAGQQSKSKNGCGVKV